MGKAMRGDPDGRRGRGSPATGALARVVRWRRRLTALAESIIIALLLGLAPLAGSGIVGAQGSDPVRLVRGRFTIVSRPGDAALARAMIEAAERNDTFPGLPRPRQAVH